MKAPQIPRDGHLPGTANDNANSSGAPGWTSSYPTELGFTAEEEGRGSKELWRLLRRQLRWAEDESESLKRSCEMLEELRRKEWLEKEILLDQVMKNEIGWHERRREVLAGMAELSTAEVTKAAADKAWSRNYSPTVGVSSPTPASIKGQPVEDQREAAAVLASLHQA
jgi:hypothetical protein